MSSAASSSLRRRSGLDASDASRSTSASASYQSYLRRPPVSAGRGVRRDFVGGRSASRRSPRFRQRNIRVVRRDFVRETCPRPRRFRRDLVRRTLRAANGQLARARLDAGVDRVVHGILKVHHAIRDVADDRGHVVRVVDESRPAQVVEVPFRPPHLGAQATNRPALQGHGPVADVLLPERPRVRACDGETRLSAVRRSC